MMTVSNPFAHLSGTIRKEFMFFIILTGLLAFRVAPADASTITIRSWDSANQRDGDLATGAGGDFDYGDFRAALLGNGDTVLSGLSTISAIGLAGVDAFFWGTSSHVLSGAESAALLAFVSGGGTLLIETETIVSDQTAANSAYNALGLGNRISGVLNGGGQPATGTFTGATTATTVGAFGDVRGLTFGSSLAAIVTPAGHTSVGFYGTTLPDTTWVEFAVGSGRVLGVGDGYGAGLFWSGGFRFNDNNRIGYMNFLHPAVVDSTVPEPTSLLLIGTGVAGLIAKARRRRRHQSATQEMGAGDCGFALRRTSTSRI